jgi:hypothetical protein
MMGRGDKINIEKDPDLCERANHLQNRGHATNGHVIGFEIPKAW